MITSAIQLKAKVRNISGGDSKVAMVMMRTFFMERFLERVAMSPYKDKFVLKGGMLVSSMVGIKSRATMDIDATVEGVPLNADDIQRIVSDICSISIEDNITFKITSIETIMDEFDYPGVRVHLNGMLDKLKQPIKLDISTDDVITPKAVDYSYGLMFEERTIELMSYNVETLLAEKTQTILARGLATTRMRDFYDIYEITQIKKYSIEIFWEAFDATCTKRDTLFNDSKIAEILSLVAKNDDLKNLWNQFQVNNYFVNEIEFETIMESIRRLLAK